MNKPPPEVVFGQPHDVAVDFVSLVMGAGQEVFGLMPAYADIPEEFRRDRTPWNQLQAEWFFRGLNTRNLKEKPGIDRARAFVHLTMIQKSFAPPHEHKSAGVAYLMSLWFTLEEPTGPAPAPAVRPDPKPAPVSASRSSSPAGSLAKARSLPPFLCNRLLEPRTQPSRRHRKP